MESCKRWSRVSLRHFKNVRRGVCGERKRSKWMRHMRVSMIGQFKCRWVEIEKYLWLTLRNLTTLLLLFALLAFDSRFKLWVFRVPWKASHHTVKFDIVGGMGCSISMSLLLRFCLSFRRFTLESKMWRYSLVDVKLICYVLTNQPGCAGPCFSRNGLLDERSQYLLCEDLAVASNVHIVHHCFFARSIGKCDKIPREWRYHDSVFTHMCAKPSLISDHALQLFAWHDMYRHSLAWIVICSKFVVDEVDQRIDSRNRLELYSAQNWAL